MRKHFSFPVVAAQDWPCQDTYLSTFQSLAWRSERSGGGGTGKQGGFTLICTLGKESGLPVTARWQGTGRWELSGEMSSRFSSKPWGPVKFHSRLQVFVARKKVVCFSWLLCIYVCLEDVNEKLARLSEWLYACVWSFKQTECAAWSTESRWRWGIESTSYRQRRGIAPQLYERF